MNLIPLYENPLLDSWNDSYELFLHDDGNVSILYYNDTVIQFYNYYSGKLWKELHTDEPIVKVIRCRFVNYGNCLCALLHNNCVIWNDAGELFTVVLLCRMESVYALDNGILFERVEDLYSMNTSFSINAPVQSIPMYFSLSSPLSIPKPFFIKQEGEEISSIRTSSFLNMSMSYSMIDLFNSHIDLNHNERDLQIISILPDYHLIVQYDRIVKRHSISRYINIQTNDIELIHKSLHETDFQLLDPFILSLSSPEYALTTVYLDSDSSEMYSKVVVIPSVNSSFHYLYCSSSQSIDCFCCSSQAITSLHSFDSLPIQKIASYSGTIIGKVENPSLLLSHCLFIQSELQWSLIYEGEIIYSSQIDKEWKDSVICNDSIYGITDDSLVIVMIKPCIDELTDRLLMLLSQKLEKQELANIMKEVFQLQTISIQSVIELLYTHGRIDVLIPSLCYLMDHYWIVNDTSSIQLLLSNLQPLVNQQEEYQLLLQCYSQIISPIWYSQVFLLSYQQPSWLPLPFLLYYFFTYHSLNPFTSILQYYDSIQDILPYPSCLIHSLLSHSIQSLSIPPTSPFIQFLYKTVNNQPIHTQSNSSASDEENSIILETKSLLENKIVNLHLQTTNSSINLQKLIQSLVDSQFISMYGNSLLTLQIDHPFSNKTISLAQLLHDYSFHLHYAGRKNNESDLLTCVLSSENLAIVTRYTAFQQTLDLLMKNETLQVFTMDDLAYICDERNEDEKIGIILALGIVGLIKKIPLSLYKLNLQFCQLTQWNEERIQVISGTNRLPYMIECSYLLSLAFAYHGTNDSQVIHIFQYYINTILSITHNKHSLTEWKRDDLIDLMRLLITSLLGLGIICHKSKNTTILEYLFSLQNKQQHIIACSSKNIILYHSILAIVEGLICIKEPHESSQLFSHMDSLLNDQFSFLNQRLHKPRKIQPSMYVTTGIECPVEEIHGILLQIGFISFYFDQQGNTQIHPIFGDETSEAFYSFLSNHRSDCCLFYGMAYALSHYSTLPNSIDYFIHLLPSSYHSFFHSLPLPIKRESYNEEYRNILCFIGGIIFITAIKYSHEGIKEQSIHHLIQSVYQIDSIQLEGRSIIEFIVLFLYSLIHLQQVSFLSIYPREFVKAMIQSLGLYAQGTADEAIFILLRRIYKDLIDIKSGIKNENSSVEDMSYDYYYQNIDDLIEVCSSSLGLISMGEGTLSFTSSMNNVVLLVIAFCPCYFTLLNDVGSLPYVCKQLIWYCDYNKKEKKQEQITHEVDTSYLPYQTTHLQSLLTDYYHGSSYESFVRNDENDVIYKQQLELISKYIQSL